MSRLDYCQYELVDDCYDWKNDNCDECNIFKAYCEGKRRAKNSIVRCNSCKWYDGKSKGCNRSGGLTMYPLCEYDYCSYGERKGGDE